jgi:hypothetical protein
MPFASLILFIIVAVVFTQVLAVKLMVIILLFAKVIQV